jgi:hypothetical protein
MCFNLAFKLDLKLPPAALDAILAFEPTLSDENAKSPRIKTQF